MHPHTHHIVTHVFADKPRRTDCICVQMDGEAGWWTTSGTVGFPLLVRVMGVGRQQQQSESKRAYVFQVPDVYLVMTLWVVIFT